MTRSSPNPRTLSEVVFVDGVRTPFGREKAIYAGTRADELVVKCIATAQTGAVI